MMMTPTRPRRMVLARLLLLGILLLGFGTRIYDLEGQSMWSDEGLSLYRARQPLLRNLQNIITVDGIATQDTNPPLYFALLHAGRALFGETVFALRYGGALAGFLAVPLMYALGTVLYGRGVGLAAALFMALSPFHVWQSQVLRNYSLLVTLNLLSVYGLARFMCASPTRRRRWLVLWAGAALLGVYTHYFGFFIFAFGLLTLLVWAVAQFGVRRLLRQRWLWIAAGLSLLILIPVIPVALERFNAGPQVDFYHEPVSKIANYAASAFSVGMSPSLTHPRIWVLPVVLLAALGVLFGWMRSRTATLLLLGYQFIPLGLLLFLSLWNPLYNGTRHLLIGLPPYLLFVAAGVVLPQRAAWRRGRGNGRYAVALAGAALGLAVIFIQLHWLREQFTSPLLVRDDVRGAAEFLAANAAADDLIVLHDTLIDFTFDYYYDGAAPVTAVPLYGEQDEAAALAALQEAAAGAQRLWFLTKPAPRTGFSRTALPEWAAANWPLIGEARFPRMWLEVELQGYLPHPHQAALPDSAQPLAATFAQALALHGVTLPAELRAGQPGWLTFYFSPLAEVGEADKLTLRFVDAQGQEWQQSHRGIWRDYPPQEWPAEEITRYDHELDLAAGLPSGSYSVWLRLENRDGAALRTEAGAEEVYLGEVTISAGKDGSKLPEHTPQRTGLGPLLLLGFDHPSEELRPGHVLPLDLFWQVQDVPQEDLAVRVELLDPDDEPVAEADGPVTRPDAPPASWQAGDIIQSKIDVVVPATAVPEAHRLRISLVAPQTGRTVGRPLILDGALPVDTWPLVTAFPAISTPLRADFGQPAAVELHGYDLAPQSAAPGNDLQLTLYWRAVTTLPANFNVFVHLVDENGQIVAQGDGPPLAGFRPTLSWRPDEVFVDEHTISLPADLAPGAYRLWTGLYDADNGQRLPAARDGEDVPNGAVVLQDVVIR